MNKKHGTTTTVTYCRNPALRRPILRGRVVLDDDDDLYSDSDVSKNAMEDQLISELRYEANKRQMLLKKRELVRNKQREERENRPDFNIVTDIAPEPNFEFSTDLSSNFGETRCTESSFSALSKSNDVGGNPTFKTNNEVDSKILTEAEVSETASFPCGTAHEIGKNDVAVNLQNITVDENIFENTRSVTSTSQFNEQNNDSRMSFMEQEEFHNVECAVVNPPYIISELTKAENMHESETNDVTELNLSRLNNAKNGKTKHKLGVEKPNLSVSQLAMTINGSPGLSAIAYERTVAENTSSEVSKQDISVNKSSLDSTRDRLLHMLRPCKDNNLLKPTAKTLLSFKTPQRTTRASVIKQNNMNVTKVVSDKNGRLTSTPINSPNTQQTCSRFEDHQQKFLNSHKSTSRTCCESSKNEVTPRISNLSTSRTTKESQTDMIALSPSTRILKTVFKDTNGEANSVFRTPRPLHPSKALQDIAEYSSSNVSSPASCKMNSMRNTGSVNRSAVVFDSSPADESSKLGQCVKTSEDCSSNEQDAKTSSLEVTDDVLRKLETSTERLSIEDSLEISSEENENAASSHSENNESLMSTPKKKGFRAPLQKALSRMKFTNDLDISMVSIGTPGLERLSDRTNQFNFEAIPSPSTDTSAISSCSNDSSVSVLPSYVPPEKPIHLVSHFSKSPTPDLLLAKRHVIHPEKPIGSVRRSRRNRIKPVRRWLGEKPVYKQDSEGNLELVDVTTVKITDPFLRRYNSASMEDAVEQRRKKQRAARIGRQMRRKWSHKM